jgi:hypothetical protein
MKQRRKVMKRREEDTDPCGRDECNEDTTNSKAAYLDMQVVFTVTDSKSNCMKYLLGFLSLSLYYL